MKKTRADLEADYEALKSQWLDREAHLTARIAQFEAVLTKFLVWNGTDYADDESRERALVGICEEAYVLIPASASETPVRRAHSKSEYKRLTAMGVACAPPETVCKHPMNLVHYHGFVSGRLLDFRCTVCNTIFQYTTAEAADWEQIRDGLQAARECATASNTGSGDGR
jgi:hypothetical protein